MQEWPNNCNCISVARVTTFTIPSNVEPILANISARSDGGSGILLNKNRNTSSDIRELATHQYGNLRLLMMTIHSKLEHAPDTTNPLYLNYAPSLVLLWSHQ